MSMRIRPTPGSPGDDDILERTLAALKRTPLVEGPSAQTMDRTLAALDAASSSSKTLFALRRKMMFTLLKVAAAVLVATGGLFYLGGTYLIGASMAFEEVAQKLHDAHTFSYVMTMEFPNAKTIITVRQLFKEPGLVRSETLPGGAVPANGPIMILDSKAGKTLAIDPAAKSAVVFEGMLPGPRHEQDLATSEVQHLRNLVQKKGEPLGAKTFGKVQTQGFRVKDDTGYETTIWVNPQTRLPVQVEVTGKAGDTPFHSTIRDFELDPKLDDSLFSLEPPPGYTSSKLGLNEPNDKDDGSPEAAVAKLLRDFAKNSAGAFPKRLDDWSTYDRTTPKGTYKSAADPALIRAVTIVVRVQIFLLERNGDYGYRGDGVKLGDADKIIFWYKPKDKQTYRALFGDLHAADVTADQLPVAAKLQSRP